MFLSARSPSNTLYIYAYSLSLHTYRLLALPLLEEILNLILIHIRRTPDRLIRLYILLHQLQLPQYPLPRIRTQRQPPPLWLELRRRSALDELEYALHGLLRVADLLGLDVEVVVGLKLADKFGVVGLGGGGGALSCGGRAEETGGEVAGFDDCDRDVPALDFAREGL